MWKAVKLEDVCELITCGVAKRPNYVETGVPFLSAKNVKNQSIVWDSYKFISPEDHEILTRHNKPKKGDVLYTRVGSFGEAAIVDKDIEFSVFVSLTLIKTKDIILNKFLVYYLNSPMGKNLAKKNVSSSGVGNLNVGAVRKFLIPLPSLKEQEHIVRKLDSAFAEIDKLKEISNKTRSIYSQLLKQIIFQCLNNKNYNWTKKYLDEISTNLDSKRKPITKSKRIKGLTPYYGASGIVDYVQRYIFDDDLLLISEDGANLISRSYPIAFSINGRSWVNNHAHVLKFNSKNIQSWVEVYLNFKNIDNFISGMAQPKLNKAKLNQIPIPIPEESKLKEIIENILNAKELIKRVDTNLIKKSELLDNLKSSILKIELNMKL